MLSTIEQPGICIGRYNFNKHNQLYCCFSDNSLFVVQFFGPFSWLQSKLCSLENVVHEFKLRRSLGSTEARYIALDFVDNYSVLKEHESLHLQHNLCRVDAWLRMTTSGLTVQQFLALRSPYARQYEHKLQLSATKT
ncbi:MAG: hypothetical protein V1837_03170 [Candidatus Woesearchaeota archaeon]